MSSIHNIEVDKIINMDVDEQKSDSVNINFSTNEIINDIESNIDTSMNKMIFESSTCEEQNSEIPQTENVSSSPQAMNTCKEAKFKKPLLLIGPKRGKIGKIRMISDNIRLQPSSSESSLPSEPLPANRKATEIIHSQDDIKDINKSMPNCLMEENVLADTKNVPVPYLEPKWSGKPTEEYKLEVLKSGVILEKIDLTERNFYVIGRLPSCHLSLAHPTISRYHAIIQYRAIADDKHSKGFYLYDLESTHGTFWNGHRIKSRTYVRLHGGHMIKFGCSQRKFILEAPLDDQEEESELSVTQLKVRL